jgi:hypothetical protein
MPDPPLPKYRPRWLRLSARGLIILVLIIGGCLGWIAHIVRNAQGQRNAVAAQGSAFSHSARLQSGLSEATVLIPSAHAEPDRYKSRPLLILLENYVLDCVGALPTEKQPGTRLAVQRVFGGGEDWKATLRRELHLDVSLDEEIRSMWKRNQEIAKARSTVLHPVQFAKMVADSNFAHLIDPPQN